MTKKQEYLEEWKQHMSNGDTNKTLARIDWLENEVKRLQREAELFGTRLRNERLLLSQWLRYGRTASGETIVSAKHAATALTRDGLEWFNWRNMITPVRITGVAMRTGPSVFISLPAPARHHDLFPALGRPMVVTDVQGFIDSSGNFRTREEAKQIARDAGQLLPRASDLDELFSEDVW